MAFNEKLSKSLLNQRPNQRPQLDAFDLEAERESTAIRNASQPTFKGSRQLNRTPHRSSLRA